MHVCFFQHFIHVRSLVENLGGCVKTPNMKILNSLCVHLWMRNEFFIFL